MASDKEVKRYKNLWEQEMRNKEEIIRAENERHEEQTAKELLEERFNLL